MELDQTGRLLHAEHDMQVNPRRTLREINKMLVLLVSDEWTDTNPTSPFAQMLEEQLHRLHNDLNEAQSDLSVVLLAALDAIGAPEDHETIRQAIRKYDSRADEAAVEEKLGVICGASRNPVERIGIEFDVAKKSADPRAVDVLLDALNCTLKEHGFQVAPLEESDHE